MSNNGRRLCVMVVSLAAISPASASSPQARLDVPADGIVNALVEGKPVRMALRGDGTSAPLLNSADAKRLGVSGGWLDIGIRVKVGPVALKGGSSVFHYTVGGIALKRRGAWLDRDIAPGLAGELGPASVDQGVVTFHLRTPAPGERLITLPLIDRGLQGMGTAVNGGVAGDVFVQFNPQRAHSIITAAGGVTLAATHHGAFIGPVRQDVVIFGISRPVREMRLAEPLNLGGLAISLVDVRTADFGNASAIPDALADPDEIVVTAAKQKGPIYRTMHVGADALAHCSSLTFDKPARQIRLTC